MKLKIEKKELEKKVRMVGPIARGKGVLTNIQIKAELFGAITLFSTDLNMGIFTTVEGSVEDAGKILVDAKHLNDVIRKLPDGIVMLNVVDDKELCISVKKTKIKLALVKGTFPERPIFKAENEITFKQTDFRDVVNGTLFATAPTDSSNKLMTGLCFHFSDNQMKVMATDGHRIAINYLKTNTAIKTEIILPNELLKEVLKLVSTKKSEDEMIMGLSDNNVIFKIEDTELNGRLLEGTYFNIDGMINSCPKDTRVIVNKQELYDSADRATLMTDVSDRKPLVLTIGNNTVDVSIRSFRGNMNESLEAEIQGKDLKIGLNPFYIMDTLKVIDDEDVAISFGSSKHPIVLTGEGYLHLILPIAFSES